MPLVYVSRKYINIFSYSGDWLYDSVGRVVTLKTQEVGSPEETGLGNQK